MKSIKYHVDAKPDHLIRRQVKNWDSRKAWWHIMDRARSQVWSQVAFKVWAQIQKGTQ